MIPPHLLPLAQATHEALGRALRGESLGEADIRNAALFSYHLLGTLAQYGHPITPEAAKTLSVQISSNAKAGPAFRP